MTKTLINKTQQLFFTFVLLGITVACDKIVEVQSNASDAGVPLYAQDVEPIGEPIEGETLAIVLCTHPQTPDLHGAGLQIGGRKLGADFINTPQAPQCDERIYGRKLRFHIIDQEFLHDPVGVWDFNNPDEEGRLYRTDTHYAQAYLDTHNEFADKQITLKGVSLSLNITTWQGDTLTDGKWAQSTTEYREHLGKPIEGFFHTVLSDGSEQSGIIEGVWCGGSAYCEED